jgi:hypothetical protein
MALLLTVSLGGAPAPAAEEKPAYWTEKRLETPVSFSKPKGYQREAPLLQRDPEEPNDPMAYRPVRLAGGVVQEVTALVKKLAKETGVPLAVQGDWAREAVALSATSLPAREWMDTLADTFKGRWFHQDQTWVLASSPNEAYLTALSKEQRGAEQRELTTNLMRTLTPNQWRKLGETGRLELGELLSAQKQTLRQKLRLYYYDPGQPRAAGLGPEALTGKGVYLGLTGSGKDAHLHLYAPAAPGAWSPLWYVSIPFYDPETGALLWGVAPPR